MEAVLTNASGRMALGSSVVRIGSAQDNHVVINDPKVASYHAEIRPEGHGEHNHTIIDLGSRTGTFVNEWLLDPNVPSLLHPHATIRIGDAIFNYEVTGIPQQDEVDQSMMPASAGVIDRASPSGGEARSITPEARPPGEMSAQVGAAPSPFDVNPLPPQGPLRIVPSDSSPPYPAAASPAQSAAMQGGKRALIDVGLASLLEKENRRKLWLAGGLTVLVILLVALLFGTLHSPGRTLDTFCSALQSGDYQTAYNQFSPGVQGQVTESSFANFFTGNRRITSCAHSSPSVSGNSAEATIITNSNHASTVWLIQDSSFNWRIDSFSGL